MKRLQRIGEQMLAAVLTVLNMLSGGTGPATPVMKEDNTVPLQKLKPAREEKPVGQRILDAIPDGGTIDYDELIKKAGSEADQILGWAKPKKISRNGNTITVECEPGAQVGQGSVTVDLDQKVEFEFSHSGETVTLTRVRGVKVSTAGLSLLRVESATITRNADGTVTVSAKAEVSRWLPYIPISVTIDPNNLP